MSTVLKSKIAELVGQYGSYRAAGKAIGVDHVYLYRLAKGDKKEAGTAICKVLGVRKVVVYEPIEQAVRGDTHV